MITEDELADWEAQADDATEGPWDVVYDGLGHPCGVRNAHSRLPVPQKPADHVFTAITRTAVLRLIAEVRRLRETIVTEERRTAELNAQFDLGYEDGLKAAAYKSTAASYFAGYQSGEIAAHRLGKQPKRKPNT